ncbi:hypothetical protein EON64_01085 [archaeon]|nr:MAG: hypothetical protein EON64_01085 [archaeon]
MLENKIRWKPLGYNVVEGQREKTLLYDIHNPNEHIQRLLHTYSEQVVHAIQHLVYVQKLLQTDGSDAGREEGDGSGYGPTHTQMARRTEGDMMYMESHLHLNHPDLPHEVIHALRGKRTYTFIHVFIHIHMHMHTHISILSSSAHTHNLHTVPYYLLYCRHARPPSHPFPSFPTSFPSSYPFHVQ